MNGGGVGVAPPRTQKPRFIVISEGRSEPARQLLPDDAPPNTTTFHTLARAVAGYLTEIDVRISQCGSHRSSAGNESSKPCDIRQRLLPSLPERRSETGYSK
jgi:hypothetical protein